MANNANNNKTMITVSQTIPVPNQQISSCLKDNYNDNENDKKECCDSQSDI